jgi:hypothetical protein
VGRASPVLRFGALAAAVVAWFAVAPHLPALGEWPNIVLVSFVVLPATLLLVLIALPLRRYPVQLAAATFVLALLAFAFSEAGWGLPENFAKLFAAVFAGWAFLALFEDLAWVVIVAAVIPLADAISVWRGPTHSITTHHFHVYLDVAIAFVVPHGAAAYLGPPDVLFYALFLAAAARWHLRVGWTWIGTTLMYGLTIVIANAAGLGGLPALPFLSVGFLGANADLLVRRRWRAVSPSSGAGPETY